MKSLNKKYTLLVAGGTEDACADEAKKDVRNAKEDLKEFMDDTLKSIGHGSQKAADKINEKVEKHTDK